MNRLESAGIIVYAIVGKQLQYLLLHYPHGHWDFAKGKIEKNESTFAAATRELHEETGLQVAALDHGFYESLSFWYTDKSGVPTHKTVHFFLGKVDTTVVKLSYEHIGYAWLPYDQALEQLTFANAKEVLKKADTFLHAQSVSMRKSN